MSDKLYVTINGKKREMNAEEIAQFQKDQAEALLFKTDYVAKQEARNSALTKLATIAGLTEEEITALGL
jgi:hypothetical protein